MPLTSKPIFFNCNDASLNCSNTSYRSRKSDPALPKDTSLIYLTAHGIRTLSFVVTTKFSVTFKYENSECTIYFLFRSMYDSKVSKY